MKQFEIINKENKDRGPGHKTNKDLGAGNKETSTSWTWK